MEALAGPFLAGAALLVLAGVGKLRSPLPLARALRLAGLPVTVPLVRAGAAAEAALGLAAVLTGSALAAAAVALSYAAFTGYVLLGLRRGGERWSCGCFGAADSAPTWTHVAVTGTLGLVAAAVAVRPVGPLHELLAGSPALGAPLLAVTAAVGVIAYVLLAVLPRRSRAGRPAARVSRPADELTGTGPDGQALVLPLTGGQQTLLVFLDDGPGSSSFWESLAEPALQVPCGARLVVVTAAPDELSAGPVRANRHGTVLASEPAWAAFGVPGPPYAVAVDGTGHVIGEGSAPTWPAVAALLERVLAEDARRRTGLRR